MNQTPRRKNVVLREKLQLITDQDTSEHRSLLVDLTDECPNSIRIVEPPPPIEQYTCLMHVLDFTDKPEFISIAKVVHIPVGPGFAHWLIEGGHLVDVSQTEAQEGDLIFYFSEDTVPIARSPSFRSYSCFLAASLFKARSRGRCLPTSKPP